MSALAESIRSDAEKLGEEVRKGTHALDVLLRKAKTTLKALNVGLTEAEGAKSEPVMLPVGSLTQARGALVASPFEASLDLLAPPQDERIDHARRRKNKGTRRRRLDGG